MTRFLACAFFLLAICGPLIAQPPPSSAPWNVTLQTNTVADSNLTVVNRCQKNHQFQIQLQNVPFLQLSTNQANVKGGQTQVIPVKFDTRNLAPGVYQGRVLVICVSCKGEATCTQDREVLQVNLTVTPEPPGPGQPPATSQPPSNQAAGQGPGVPANLSLDLANLREAQAAAQEAADKAKRAAETAEQDARNAKAQADAARKGVTDAVKEVNKAHDAVAEAEKERDRANREGTTAERKDAQAALEKAKADLAAKEKALKDAQAVAGGNSQAEADDAARKAAEKKAEAEKAAAALAAAQAAVAEKEKEILKAQPKAVASTTPKTDPPPPTPCKNGEIRNLKKETKEFIFADDDSVVEFSSSATSEGGQSAALSMAALWRAGAKIGGVVTEGLATARGSAHGIGFVFDYLNKGADILEKLADSPISGLNAGVSASVAITTKKVTVTCTTFEVCVNKVWVRKAVLDRVEGAGPVHKASKRAHLGDPERDKVQDSSRPQFLDPAKVDKWLKDFLAGELNKLKLAKEAYADFVKNCK